MAKRRAKMGEIWPKKKSAGRRSIIEASVPPQLRVKKALVVRLLEQREPGGVMRHVVGASDRFGHVDQARGREHAAVPTHAHVFVSETASAVRARTHEDSYCAKAEAEACGQLALQRPGGPLRSPQCGMMSQHSQSAVLNIVYRGSVSAHFGQAA